MSDITMCSSKKCPQRITCYRYRAKPTGPGQSYARFMHNGERCPAYWSVNGRRDSELLPMSELEPKTKSKERV